MNHDQRDLLEYLERRRHIHLAVLDELDKMIKVVKMAAETATPTNSNGSTPPARRARKLPTATTTSTPAPLDAAKYLTTRDAVLAAVADAAGTVKDIHPRAEQVAKRTISRNSIGTALWSLKQSGIVRHKGTTWTLARKPEASA